jgi:anti-sigma B factor antagonist
MPEELVLADPIARQICAAPAVFECTLTDGLHRSWVHVAGELDIATTPRLERTLRRAERHAHFVVLDLRGLTFMDCSGVHVIIDAALRAREAGRRQVVLVRGRSAVERVFVLTGALNLVQIVNPDSGEPALQAFGNERTKEHARLNATATPPTDGPKLAAVISAPVVELDICSLTYVSIRHGIDRVRRSGQPFVAELVNAGRSDELNDRGRRSVSDLRLPAEEACRWMR